MIRLIHYPSRFSYDLIVAILFVSFHFLTSLTFSSFCFIVSMQAHSIGLFFKRSCLRNERVDNVRLVNLCFNVVFCFSFILLAFSLKRFRSLFDFVGVFMVAFLQTSL